MGDQRKERGRGRRGETEERNPTGERVLIHFLTRTLLCLSSGPPNSPQGVGYGLLLALYSNDQEYFNMQLDNAERYMWNWRK